jgi:hypothetical protein
VTGEAAATTGAVTAEAGAAVRVAAGNVDIRGAET